jgi:Carboxypeptidase regulatory-like domain
MFRSAAKLALCAALALVAFASSVRAMEQDKQDNSYVNRNHVDYGPLMLSRVEGVAKAPDGSVVPGVRVLLFSESEHQLITATVTDEHGFFTFGKVAYGSYRLVTKSSFCPANVPIEVSRFEDKTKKLYLQMVVGSVDICSFGEVK